ncbi:MAG: alanine--glyoxylate aminotransferase family protein [Microbacterium ginsengisoli]|uniref:aminotransferase class V-fold PLP-dependent enzyme n=2 Tax=Microbacteriaceae TaxID=85023 RepID=UPI0006F7CB56|nr:MULTISPECIES: aminotransferase class V-fold PLP-dependent enzyme [unclassified Microbacterium]KQR91263.1 hypothetical protein ASF93_07915 [Microbacterium sp. Leaf347]KQS01255.1 hypothetical protein ASG00_10740 [Microbacterium sp. Leaf351]MBN9197065.1 alanine--glyoxylate aminotransferase family protein [Microbacterium ginsengisoli]OJU77022.1 MAG: hypothetical protein BGO15_05830 [Microbacterium sp. 71-23]
MTTALAAPWHPLWDVPAFPAARYALLSDRIGALVGASDVHDTVIVPGEAIVALEAVAREVGHAGQRVLNIVTSHYGGLFGEWLAQSGAEVTTLAPLVAGGAIETERVAAALAQEAFTVVSLVHGEGATAIVNPLSTLLSLARAAGALTVVDAVASVGAEPVDVTSDGIDILVAGPQKGWSGPSAISTITVSPAGWNALRRTTPTAALSAVSLLDLQRDWLTTDRTRIPGTAPSLELWALDAAITRVELEGHASLVARHRAAAEATFRAVTALGLQPWARGVEEASGLMTGILLPDGTDRSRVLRATSARGSGITAGVGDVPAGHLRLNHTGPRAGFATIAADLTSLALAVTAEGVRVDLAAAATELAALPAAV